MHYQIYRSSRLAVDRPPLSKGIDSGCPFCLAKCDQRPSLGQKILFLNSGDVGQFGCRIEDKHNSVRFDQFLVKMDYEIDENISRVVTPLYDLFLIEPIAPPPGWMLPLSIEDALSVHENMLRGLDYEADPSGESPLRHLCYPIVTGTWWRRLPLSADDIWPMLQAHNFFQSTKKDFATLFDFGNRVLVRARGRPAIKRKRMPPLSRGRYQPDSQANRTPI
jgi:hypothetical protein